MADCIAALLEASSAREVVQLCTNGGGDGKELVVDVTEFAGVEQPRDTVYAGFGRVDFLMNNAGIGIRATPAYYRIRI